MKILFVGYRDKNHSSAGGYDQIIRMPQSDSIMGEEVPFGKIPVGKRGKFINLFFLRIYVYFIQHKYHIVHYFYGEMTRCFAVNKSVKIVATVHMKINPNGKLIKHLKRVNGVIALSRSQAKELKNYGINAIYIPHGFSAPKFQEADMGLNKDMINLVVAGTNYRDLTTLFNVIDYCDSHNHKIHFHLLGQSQSTKDKCINYKNVTCYPRLTDNEYFSIIKQSDYNFLPLTFATANNTLLEAAYLGKISILPYIDGILDYAAPSPYNMYYKSIDDLYNILATIGKCPNVEHEVIKFAHQFDWANIYPQLLSFYKSL